MDYTTLQYFVAVCQKKNLTQVANSFYVSRQALSKAMIKLEKEVGAELFIRNHSGVVVTEAGQFLYDKAVQILEIWDRSLTEIQSSKTMQCQTLQVGYGQMSYGLWEPDHAVKFERTHPGIKIQIKIMQADQLRTSLLDRELDIAVTRYCNSSLFSRTVLLHRNLYALLSEHDSLLSKEYLCVEDLRDRTIICLPENSEFINTLSKILLREHISAHFVSAQDSSLIIILQMVQEKQGVFFTIGNFSTVLRLPDYIKALPFVCQDSSMKQIQNLYAVTLKETERSDAARQYIDYLATSVKKPPDII